MRRKGACGARAHACSRSGRGHRAGRHPRDPPARASRGAGRPAWSPPRSGTGDGDGNQGSAVVAVGAILALMAGPAQKLDLRLDGKLVELISDEGHTQGFSLRDGAELHLREDVPKHKSLIP